MTANAALLRVGCAGDLDFTGVIVSDYNAIAELIRHGVAADLAEAAALALNAGVDIDMMAGRLSPRLARSRWSAAGSSSRRSTTAVRRVSC